MKFQLDTNSRRLLSAARWAEAERRSADGHATVDPDLNFMAQLESVWPLIEAAATSSSKDIS